MGTKSANKNVTDDVKKWGEALADAEAGLKRAQQDVAQWKGAIAVIRKRIQDRASWPGSERKYTV